MAVDDVPSIDDLAAVVALRAQSPEPEVRLRAAIELGRELTETGDALVERFVAAARDAGLSWAEIGTAFGTSKQAAQQRFGAAAAEVGFWPGRWTPAAWRALDVAATSARELRHRSVGTEHVLLALLGGGDDVAAHVLAELGVTTAFVERALPGPCEPPYDQCLGVMPRLKRALESAPRLAGEPAGTEHLLAAIVAIEDALAMEILADAGVSADTVRAAIAARLGIAPARLQPTRPRRRRLLSKAT